MGEMFAFSAPKLKIEVKTSVFAKPHSPLMKNAATDARIHKYIRFRSISCRIFPAVSVRVV